MMQAIGIIPARYASTRFPGKSLAVLGDKTIIQRVWEQASKASLLDALLVATDDEAIKKHVESCGGKAVLTSPEHPSGTDRVHEALLSQPENYDVVVNIQGDEPFIDPAQIDALIAAFDKPEVNIATMAAKIENSDDLFNSHVVKLTLSSDNKALYFSRAAIPYIRQTDKNKWHEVFNYYKHLGIYAYRPQTLKQLVALKPGTLELAEALEQLRWLEAGYEIFVVKTDKESIGIDTYDDLIKAKIMLDKKNEN